MLTYFDVIPGDILDELLIRLPFETLKELGGVSNSINEKYKNVNSPLWKQIYKDRINDITPTNNNLKDQYFLIMEQFLMDPEHPELIAAKYNAIEPLLLLLETQKYNQDQLYNAMITACKNGQFESFRLLYETRKNNYPGAYLQIAAWEATMSGNRDIIDFLLEKNIINNDNGLHGASYNNQVKLVYYFLERGATNYDVILEGSAEAGNLELFQFGESIHQGPIDYSECIANAAFFGYLHIIEYIFETRKAEISNTKDELLKRGMFAGAIDKHEEIIKYLISQGSTDYNSALLGATEHNHFDTMDWMISLGANVKECLKELSKSWDNYDESMKYLINNGANNFNECLLVAAQHHGSIHKIKFLVNAGADDFITPLNDPIVQLNPNTIRTLILLNERVHSYEF